MTKKAGVVPSITDGVHRNENLVEIIPVFSTFSNFFKKKIYIYIKAILCNFSMRLLKCFLKNARIFFALNKLKKPPSKVAQNSSNPLFFPYCPDCPNSPKRRNSVPKCGLLTNCIKNWGKKQKYLVLR